MLISRDTGLVELGHFETESGEVIDNLKLQYEYVGHKGQPLVVVCHALTGNHLTYGDDENPGWWREIIDGGYLSINDYQFITFNVIGSPYGSSSKLNTPDFPERLSMRDISKANILALKHFGYEKIDVLIGGSLGGMQTLEMLYDGSIEVKKAVILAATEKTSSYSRAFNEIARQVINMNGQDGLSIARQIGFLTYRSSKDYESRFSADDVVSYQKYQGNKFKDVFNKDCYLTLLDVLDSHDIFKGRDDVEVRLQQLETKVLTLGFADDLLYPDDQVRALGRFFKYHRHFFVPDNVGHDGFLLNFGDWAPYVYHFLKLHKFKAR
ncbi:alpha/beta fold hydrolase [Mammaliicoccus sp. G-M28]|uniref:homoserine O-acetyltransferase MetX n=1 Tax=Mammaliicoccus sp. G-M28 TaxID=2898688 RepID=UPI001EFA983E|nr:alpha/beta fold hydrolase [Mammaliicoccus sp. G-M28]